MKQIIKVRHDRGFYKKFFAMTFAIALQNLLTYSVGLADNLMLGAYSETALSGVALCNQIQFLLQMLVVGTSDGVVVLGSQYWGRKKYAPIVQIIGVALKYSLGIAAVIFMVVFCAPSGVLGMLTNDKAVIVEGQRYFQVICFTYLIFAVTNVLSASLRSVGIIKVGYIISGSTLCINLCLNYCLIYGNLGFPELGVRGAAVATLVSRCVELLILVVYLKCWNTELDLTLRRVVKTEKMYHLDYRKISLPVLAIQLQWGVVQMVQTSILGHLGGDAIAANAIAVIVFQILTVVIYGAAGASGILVGKTIGEGKDDELKRLVTTFQFIFIGLGILSAVMIVAVSRPILQFYNISTESQGLAHQFMLVLAITTLGTSYQMSCDTGIIRGGGDTGFSAKMNTVSMWLISVPIALAAAFIFRLPTIVVFFFLKWDQLYKCIPVAIRLHSWKWVKKVTRVRI